MVRTQSRFRNLIKGAVAGLLATFPMTLFMRTAWRMLPPQEKYPLPPRQLTNRLVQELEPPVRLNQDRLTALTYLLHFLFGAATGALYGVLEDRVPLHDDTKGPLMGMAVWAGSYLGWIPLLRMLPPATRHPWQRNVLMIVTHLIWGLALGTFTRMLKSKKGAYSIPLE